MSDIAVHVQVTKSSSSGNRPADNAGTHNGGKGMDFLDMITKLANEKTTNAAHQASKNAAKSAADQAQAAALAKANLGSKITATKTTSTPDPAKPATATDTDTDTDTNSEDTVITISDASDDDATSGLVLDLSGDNGQTPTLDAAGLKTLKAALDSLLHGLPAGQKPVTVKLTVGQLQKIVQDLKANASDIQTDHQALIATGLSPEQLTALSDAIAKGNLDQLNEDNSGLKAILAGILKLVPDGEGTKTVFFPKTLMLAKDKTDATQEKSKDDDKTEDTTSSLTALFTVPAAPMDTSGVKADDPAAGGIVPDKKPGGGFNEVLKMLENLQANAQAPAAGDKIADAATQQAAAKSDTPQPGPVNSTTGAASFDSLIGSLTSGGPSSDGTDLSQTNQYGLGAMSASGMPQMTSLITQASNATQSHPATQVVAAVIARSMDTGETKNIMLRLDPPDLGKIEIQMQFAKDKSVKTHMIFEKPETMLMMQRDSGTLQRAMQNAGMDANNNGLSFELAGQDHAFNGNQSNNQGSGGGNSNNSSGANEPHLIESTMSWSVDTATGQHHYNVLA